MAQVSACAFVLHDPKGLFSIDYKLTKCAHSHSRSRVECRFPAVVTKTGGIKTMQPADICVCL